MPRLTSLSTRPPPSSEPNREMVPAQRVKPVAPLTSQPTVHSKAPSKGIKTPHRHGGLIQWIGRVVAGISKAIFQSCWFAVRSVFSYLRHYPGNACISVILVGTALILFLTGSRIHIHHVQAKLLEDTVSELVTVSKFTREYNLNEAESFGLREFYRVGAPTWVQRESMRAVLETARAKGLSVEHQAVLLATVEVESGFNPLARASTTTACGLFQFIRSTGSVYGLSGSECLNPWINARAGITHYLHNYQRRVEPKVGELEGPEKVLTMFELSYYLHHDGPLSTEFSNELKATILSATPYLFKAYEVLKKEKAREAEEPSFFEKFWEEFQSLKEATITYVNETIDDAKGLHRDFQEIDNSTP